jgi:Rieske Fe-S protein
LPQAKVVSFNRREFLILAAAVAVPGCQSAPDDSGNTTEHSAGRTFNAGNAATYAADGVYDRFQYQGFFIVRRGEKLLAIASICTHRKCRLKTEPDHTFYCPCHGSTFDVNGQVTKGLARRELPVFTTALNERGELLVTIPGS